MPADDAEDPAAASIDIPCLDAGRWRLRPLHDDDAGFILSALNDPGMLRARSALPPVDEAASGEWIARATRASADGTYAPWVLLAGGDDTPIGLIVLQAVDRAAGTAEVGYFVSTGWRERGAATSALAAVAAWAFGVLGLHRMYLLHDADNTASCRVALRAGFRIEGVLRASRRRRDGSRCDEELHARLSTDPPTTRDD